MKTTINEIMKLNPCKDGLDRLLCQVGREFCRDESFSVASLVEGENTIGDILWLLGETGKKKEVVQFAVACAEMVIHLYTGESDAPKNAIAAAKRWIDSPSKENTDDAAAYADAAAADASKERINAALVQILEAA